MPNKLEPGVQRYGPEGVFTRAAEQPVLVRIYPSPQQLVAHVTRPAALPFPKLVWPSASSEPSLSLDQDSMDTSFNSAGRAYRSTPRNRPICLVDVTKPPSHPNGGMRDFEVMSTAYQSTPGTRPPVLVDVTKPMTRPAFPEAGYRAYKLKDYPRNAALTVNDVEMTDVKGLVDPMKKALTSAIPSATPEKKNTASAVSACVKKTDVSTIVPLVIPKSICQCLYNSMRHSKIGVPVILRVTVKTGRLSKEVNVGRRILFNSEVGGDPRCKWDGCDEVVERDFNAFDDHVLHHHIRTEVKYNAATVRCLWEGCGRKIAREELYEHVVKAHVILISKCRWCNSTFFNVDEHRKHAYTLHERYIRKDIGAEAGTAIATTIY